MHCLLSLQIVVMSDNGGPIYLASDPLSAFAGGANNYPLRGGKRSNLEGVLLILYLSSIMTDLSTFCAIPGGVRVNAFISGGFLPKKQRGKVAKGLISIEDWYGTFCSLAGVDSFDEAAAKADLPPVDSVDQWPYLSGQTQYAPRDFIILGSADPTSQFRAGPTRVQG